MTTSGRADDAVEDPQPAGDPKFTIAYSLLIAVLLPTAAAVGTWLGGGPATIIWSFLGIGAFLVLVLVLLVVRRARSTPPGRYERPPG